MALLSHDLMALKIWFDQVLDGCELTREGAEAFSAQLAVSIEKAEVLEDTAVDQAVRLVRSQLGGNVVPFPTVLRRVPLQGGDVA